ncbi:MAG TPA: hypothetical protein VFO85_14900 [Vicinamibacteria bacterium]|nr:hypothetical protein [Vicinamibacteria bacterium]
MRALAATSASESTLKDWVRQHRVTWEAAPRREMVDGACTRVVGYQVRLYGRVAADGATPAGENCVATYEHLRAIARAALPADAGHTRCEIERFDSALHMRPGGDWQPEIELTIQLMHSGACERPLDDSERAATSAIEARLKVLGAQPGRWVKTA